MAILLFCFLEGFFASNNIGPAALGAGNAGGPATLGWAESGSAKLSLKEVDSAAMRFDGGRSGRTGSPLVGRPAAWVRAGDGLLDRVFVPVWYHRCAVVSIGVYWDMIWDIG